MFDSKQLLCETIVSCIVALMVAQGHAQDSGLVNGGMEAANQSDQPAGWFFSKQADPEYRYHLDSDHALAGQSACLIDTNQVSAASPVGNLMQSINATPFRGKRVRFRAAVKLDSENDNARAQLWFRVDRENEQGEKSIGHFDNMQNRPIGHSDWQHYEVVADIDDDATRIALGLLVFGNCKVWLDDVSLDVVDQDTKLTPSSAGVPGNDSPQPFYSHWLWLAVLAISLMVVSQTEIKSTRAAILQRFSVRFSLAYWLLYYLPTPLVSIFAIFKFDLATRYQWCVTKVVTWTADHVFGIEGVVFLPGGSGDSTFDFVRLFVCFSLAFGIAMIWSAVDWRKTDCRWTKDLMRSFLRYALASYMMAYGLAKVGFVMTQFADPGISQLMKPYGESSPMNLLWTFMGASRPYTMFGGWCEVLGGVLLVWRRTTMLGAMVVIGVMSNVVLLNFCYDVPVKQFSFHLWFTAVFLLLPERRRLINLFLRNQSTEPADLSPPYIQRAWAMWSQRAVKLGLIVILILMPAWQRFNLERKNTGPSEPAFFGTYLVETFQKDGQLMPPDLNDRSRWRNLTIRRSPWNSRGEMIPTDSVLIRMMAPDHSQSAMAMGTITITEDGSRHKMSIANQSIGGLFDLRIVDDQHIEISSQGDQPQLTVKLRRLSREDFLLVNRGFRWINERPYNR